MGIVKPDLSREWDEDKLRAWMSNSKRLAGGMSIKKHFVNFAELKVAISMIPWRPSSLRL
jgi:hypothetical protein